MGIYIYIYIKLDEICFVNVSFWLYILSFEAGL